MKESMEVVSGLEVTPLFRHRAPARQRKAERLGG